MEQQHKGRGGWRGGGRPKKNRKAITIYLDLDVIEWLQEVPNKSDYINQVLQNVKNI